MPILRPASAADAVAVNELLKSNMLMELDAGAQFGPQYVLAVGVDTSVVGIAGVSMATMDCCGRWLCRKLPVSAD